MSFLGGHLEYTPFSGIHNSLPEYSVVGKKIGTFCIIIKNMHADILVSHSSRNQSTSINLHHLYKHFKALASNNSAEENYTYKLFESLFI